MSEVAHAHHVGKQLAKNIDEIIETGTLQRLEELRQASAIIWRRMRRRGLGTEHMGLEEGDEMGGGGGLSYFVPRKQASSRRNIAWISYICVSWLVHISLQYSIVVITCFR